MGRVVKGLKFQNLRDAGDPGRGAPRVRGRGADEIVFLDIAAVARGAGRSSTSSGRAPPRGCHPVHRRRRRPLGRGRGELLSAGADQVSVNTAAVADPSLLSRLAERFGSQCVVVGRALDGETAMRRRPTAQRAGWSSRRTAADRTTGPGRAGVDRRGVAPRRRRDPAHLVDADGTRAGFDLEMLAAVCARANVPMVASGGAGQLDHFADALAAGASAVLAASIFHRPDLHDRRGQAGAGAPRGCRCGSRGSMKTASAARRRFDARGLAPSSPRRRAARC